MAIEKMTLINIVGGVDALDETLIHCLDSGVFQPEDASKLSEYSVGKQALTRNPYSGLLSEVSETASSMNAALEYREFGELRLEDYETFLEKSRRYLEELREGACGKSGEELSGFLTSVQEELLKLYSKTRHLYDAYNLRRFVAVINQKFYLVGFVPQRQEKGFLDRFGHVPDIVVSGRQAGEDPRLEVPVKLRNNIFTRPFEMFVQMYGSPSYKDIDPTPFVAYTYCLLFGMMFGDVGQGLVISLLGFILWHWKKAALGRIMARIGIVSAVFGAAYGSVFGYEHVLDPMFRAMGFAEKPIHVMDANTTNILLVTTVAIGVVLILAAMLLNICIGIKRRSVERTLLSQNGIAGIVFYASVILAVVSLVLLQRNILSLPFVLICIVLPLLLIFFREPLHRLLSLRSKEAKISSDEGLRASRVNFQDEMLNILDVFGSRYLKSRFGRIPTDSYNKLVFYEDEPFVLHPIKTDQDYIWCFYAAASIHEDRIDAIFDDLRFERIYIPDEVLTSNESAKEFIHKCIEGETGSDAKTPGKKKTLMQHIFPDGVGSFFIESFFEMFEVLLSFITNTVSFLRIGGFILVHAGMMSVVFVISGMLGSGASIAVVVLGNLFVMGMEGLIVGIQSLRLEFYEMFSRFFDGAGTKFEPVKPGYGTVGK